ncbi:hypothetical protein VNO77_37582 [Canavalia gladiata]|uniref:Uncharacterized protein n=1 Tax=Canavalia gladiata TaxID=3824 RepID=A0AAN9KA75_CANGL
MEAKLEEAEWVQARMDQLNLIDEKRLTAMCHGQLYQRRMKKAFEKKVHPRQFREGDLVLKKVLPMQKASQGKWAPNYHGPYVVKRTFSGGALILADMDGKDLPNPTNSDAVKKNDQTMSTLGQICEKGKDLEMLSCTLVKPAYAKQRKTKSQVLTHSEFRELCYKERRKPGLLIKKVHNVGLRPCVLPRQYDSDADFEFRSWTLTIGHPMASKPKHSRNGSASPETHKQVFLKRGNSCYASSLGNRTLLTVEAMNKTSHKQPQVGHYTRNRANSYLVKRSLEAAYCLCLATSSRKPDLGFRELGLVSQVYDRQRKDSLAITQFEVNSNQSETVIST